MSEAKPFEQTAIELIPPLKRYLNRLVGDPATADDLLQETLVRVSRGLPSFAGQSSLKTWAFSIATRVVADYYRAPEHRQHIVDIDETGELPAVDKPVAEQMIVDEMNACIRGVIDTLPEDYRAALVLHDLEGLTAAQVAEINDCSTATAKIRIHRARKRLREALQNECRFYRDGDSVFRCDRKPS